MKQITISLTIAIVFMFSTSIAQPKFSTLTPNSGDLKIDILNVQGVVDKQLFAGKVGAGIREVQIVGNTLNSGVYFILIHYNNGRKIENVLRKVVLNSR